MSGQLTRAQIFCKIAVLIADGLPAPKELTTHEHNDELAVTIQCVKVAHVSVWAASVGAQLGTPHDGIYSASTFDWHGHYMYIVAYEGEGDEPPVEDDLSKVRDVADGAS